MKRTKKGSGTKDEGANIADKLLSSGAGRNPSRPLTEDEQRELEMMSNGMPRELIMARDGIDDPEYFNVHRDPIRYGEPGAWLELSSEQSHELRRKLFEMIQRLENSQSLRRHWLRLYAEVSAALQRHRKARMSLLGCSFGGIVLDSMLSTLRPVSRESEKKIKGALESLSKAADKLAAKLRYLKESGFDVRRLLPEFEDVVGPEHILDRPAYSESDRYGRAKRDIYLALRRYRLELCVEDAEDDAEKVVRAHALSDAALAYVVGDADSLLHSLEITSGKAKRRIADGVEHIPLTENRRIARELAKELAHRFKRYLGDYRYDRAAAIASAATGIDISGKSLRETTERPKRTRNRKAEK